MLERRGRAGIRTSDRAGHLSDRNRNPALYRRPLQGRRQASEGHYIHQCVCRWYCSGRGNVAGLSRSGTTITACLLSGFNRKFAVKYSFIMSIPAILGAMVLELKDFADLSVSGMDITCYIVGMVIAAVIGYICIKTMLVIVRNRKFRVFAVYCLIVGLLSIGGFSIHYRRYFWR